MNSIDYVIPMVFPSDRQWLADYRRVSCRRPEREVRFRSWGTERLLVQCVRRNLPFVRDVVILLARDSQVQPWMEMENVRVVTHAEFIPKRFLPTFNSCAIEMFLHRIPGLSERFLYSNDDIFPLSPLQESDFFQDGRPCQHHTERGYPSQPNIFHKSCLAGINFVAREFGKHFSDTWLKGGHTIVWFGTGWNLELYVQANARLHRQGQEKPVMVYRLIVPGTVDEIAAAAIDRKDGVQGALLNGLTKLMNKHNRKADK